MKKLISVVLPAYNEEDNVEPFCAALREVLAGMGEAFDHEIIFVDDGSRDATKKKVLVLASRDPRVKLVALSRNFGHQAALTAGLQRASGDAAISMDCDFQDPPAIIPEMLARWQEGYRVVYARRRTRDDRAFKKTTASLFYRLLGGMADVRIPHQVGDYRLIDKIVLKNLLRLDEHARFLRGMVAWLGFEPAFVDFDRPERLHGKTHYSLINMLRFAMDGLLSFSFKPLRIAFWVGALAIIASGGFIVYMLWDHFARGVPYMLYKWLTVILFGFMGAQFILLWIIGEYIGRIYGDVRRRPLYVIAEEVNFGDTP